MSKEEKKKLILDFINGPLYEYLNDEISFGKFKERINEVCGTNFSYSELYPSYLFNAILSYDEDYVNQFEEATIISENKKDPFNLKDEE